MNRHQQTHYDSMYVISTWNVRSLGLYQVGKQCNVIQEMNRMNIDVLGISETFWDGTDDFETTLPTTGEKFRVGLIFSGGDKRRRGVAFILRNSARTAVKYYQMISDRIICVRLKAIPVDLIIIQIYAPTSDATQDETGAFYE